MVVARFGGAENGESVFNADKVSIWKDKRCLETVVTVMQQYALS